MLLVLNGIGFSCGGEECQLEGDASFGEFALNWPCSKVNVLPAFRITDPGSHLRPPESRRIGGDLYLYPYELISELVLLCF